MNPTTTPAQQAQKPAEQTPAVVEGAHTETPPTATAAPAVETPSTPSTEATDAQANATALAAKDAEIASLKAEIAALKAAPGDSTSHVINTPKNNEHPADDPSSPEAFIGTFNRAKALFNELP